MSHHNRLSVVVTTLLLLGCPAVATKSVQAAGESYGASQEDLKLIVNYRWAGGTVGGYYPLRIRLQNRGPGRELNFAFRPSTRDRLPVVTRRIAIDQNASARFTFLIPLAGSGDSGRLFVEHNGRSLERLEHRISLPSIEHRTARPALLAISSEVVELQTLEDAVTSLNYPHGRPGGRHYGSSSTNHEIVDPAWLPDNWLAYSSVDLAMIPLETLETLSEQQQAALRDWTRTGGTLLVHTLGSSAEESEPLATLLRNGVRSRDARWQDADFEHTRGGIEVVTIDEHGNQQKLSESKPHFTWSVSRAPFQIQNYGFGRVVGFAENPFPGSAQDWGWLMKNIPFQKLRHGRRYGTASRLDNEEFLEFLIPGVRSVPLVAFLVFISLFALLIGPLNYFVLSRQNRLNFLVVTIPVIACATIGLLLSYSVVAHGFSVKSRVRSLTLIDQGTQTATSSARLALYAGLSPSDGLRFSPSTAVLPIRPKGQNFQTGHTDWTGGQLLRSGWLRSRTRTQFLTMNVRPERGRLNVSPPAGGRLPVTNGLEWDLEALIVTDKDGQPFFATGIPAGAEAELSPAGRDNREAFLELMSRSAPRMPEELRNRRDATKLNIGPTYRRYWGNREDFHVSQGQMEQRISAIRDDINNADLLPSNTWLAITRDAPSIEFGTSVKVADEWHLVVGYY